MTAVDLRVSATGGGGNSIWVTYNRDRNLLFMYNSTGTALAPGNCVAGSAVQLQNGNGSLNCQLTTVSVSDPDQNSLIVTWSITPRSAFASTTSKFQCAFLYCKNDT